MRISGIYKIHSLTKSDRIYIGSGLSIQKRWGDHLYLLRKNKHHSIKLQNHYNKYGESDLQFSILLGCEKEDLIKIEQYFIDSYKPWFNVCPKAGSSLGIKRKPRSDEWKRKQRESQSGRKQSEQQRLNSAKARIGHLVSIETKQKIRESLMGRKRPIEVNIKGWKTRKKNKIA